MSMEHMNDEELLRELSALADELHAAPHYEAHMTMLIGVIDACVKRGLWESRVDLVIKKYPRGSLFDLYAENDE